LTLLLVVQAGHFIFTPGKAGFPKSKIVAIVGAKKFALQSLNHQR